MKLLQDFFRTSLTVAFLVGVAGAPTLAQSQVVC